jgi:hypothetical protein
MSDSKICYQFPLNGFILNITDTTITTLNEFVVKTGFYNLSLTTISDIIQKYSDDGLLTKTQYDIAISELLRFSKLNEIDHINASMMLSSIFYAFDRTDSDIIDTIELICGLAVICDGYVI